MRDSQNDRSSRTSRRKFLQLCGSAVGGVGEILAQPSPSDALRVTRLYSWEGAVLEAVSPDGTQLCLWRPVTHGMFLTVLEAIARVPLHPPVDTLFLLDTASGQAVQSFPYNHWVRDVSFDASGTKLLFANDDIYRKRYERICMDLRTGENEQWKPHDLGDYYGALWDDLAFFMRSDLEDFRIVTLPDRKEVRRAPKGLTDQDRNGHLGYIRFSDDRERMVHTLDPNFLIYRDSGTLEVLWSDTVEPEQFSGGFNDLSVSPKGSYVAASLEYYYPRDKLGVKKLAGWAVRVYDRRGNRIANLPLNGTNRLGVSPDGLLLAVGNLGPSGSLVDIHELPTGRKISSIVHQSPEERTGDLGSGAFVFDGIRFVSNTTLVTSTEEFTRVWSIQRG